MRLILICFLAAVTLAAATPTERDTRHHFDLTASRATANFRSADSIDARLQKDGQVLHPRLIALRAHIEAVLNEARYEMDERDFAAAEDALTHADALLDRFAREIGGY